MSLERWAAWGTPKGKKSGVGGRAGREVDDADGGRIDTEFNVG